eukprot:7712262-Pyramimonas_sp.AAC.1
MPEDIHHARRPLHGAVGPHRGVAFHDHVTPRLESNVHGVSVHPQGANITRLGGVHGGGRLGCLAVGGRVARHDPDTPPEVRGRA